MTRRADDPIARCLATILMALVLAWPALPAPSAGAVAPPAAGAPAADFKTGLARQISSLEELVSSTEFRDWREGDLLATTIQKELAILQGWLKDFPGGWNPDAARTGWTQAEITAMIHIAMISSYWEPVERLDGSCLFFRNGESLSGTNHHDGIVLAGPAPAFSKALDGCKSMHSALNPVEDYSRGGALEAALKAAKRHDLFIQNTFDQEFPWEALINSAWAKGTQDRPPTWQFIFGHIQGGIAVPVRGKTTVTPSFILEGIGYERLNRDTYVRTWGASAIFVPATSTSDHNGVGLLLRLGGVAQAQSLGAVIKKTDSGGHVGSLVYSINLGSIFKKF